MASYGRWLGIGSVFIQRIHLIFRTTFICSVHLLGLSNLDGHLFIRFGLIVRGWYRRKEMTWFFIIKKTLQLSFWRMLNFSSSGGLKLNFLFFSIAFIIGAIPHFYVRVLIQFFFFVLNGWCNFWMYGTSCACMIICCLFNISFWFLKKKIHLFIYFLRNSFYIFCRMQNLVNTAAPKKNIWKMLYTATALHRAKFFFFLISSTSQSSLEFRSTFVYKNPTLYLNSFAHSQSKCRKCSGVS